MKRTHGAASQCSEQPLVGSPQFGARDLSADDRQAVIDARQSVLMREDQGALV